MLPRKGRGLDADASFAAGGDLLDHNHGIAAVGQRVPGIDGPACPPFLQFHGAALARGKGVRRAHRIAVHGGGMGGGSGIAGMDRSAEHTSGSLLRGRRFFTHQGVAIQSGLYRRHGVVQGQCFQVHIAFECHAASPFMMPFGRTSVRSVCASSRDGGAPSGDALFSPHGGAPPDGQTPDAL